MQRLFQSRHGHASSAYSSQSQLALCQLKVGGAKEMKLLVEISKRFGALIQGRVTERRLVQIYEAEPYSAKQPAVCVPDLRSRA